MSKPRHGFKGGVCRARSVVSHPGWREKTPIAIEMHCNSLYAGKYADSVWAKAKRVYTVRLLFSGMGQLF